MNDKDGPQFKFDVTVWTFDDLVEALCEYEFSEGFSTIEMLRRFVKSEWDEVWDEWMELFLLLLGTTQIKKWV